MAAKQHTPSPYLASALADLVGGNEEATACSGLPRQDGGRHRAGDRDGQLDRIRSGVYQWSASQRAARQVPEPAGLTVLSQPGISGAMALQAHVLSGSVGRSLSAAWPASYLCPARESGFVVPEFVRL